MDPDWPTSNKPYDTWHSNLPFVGKYIKPYHASTDITIGDAKISLFWHMTTDWVHDLYVYELYIYSETHGED